MGNGIAHVFARSGYEVALCDLEQEFLDRALSVIARNLDREVVKAKISEAQKAATLKRITPITNRSHLADCDFIVEAASEKFDVKSELFRDLDRICRPEVILASNTSSISITKLAAATSRPQRVIGMHFFNPVPVMKLVEVVRGLATSDETFRSVRELSVKLEKTPVEVNDAPGFVSNRVLMPLLNEAMYAVMEGVATPEAVDEVFKLGMAHPMGPLALADFIGLDVCLDIMQVLQRGLGDPKYRPCLLEIRVGDLLATALCVLLSTLVLGCLRPRRAWRWILIVGPFVPLMRLAAYLLMSQQPYRAQIWESGLGFLTGIAGSYAGALGRKGVDDLFRTP